MRIEKIISANMQSYFIGKGKGSIEVGGETSIVIVFIFYIHCWIIISRHHWIDSQSVFTISQQYYFTEIIQPCTHRHLFITILGIERKLALWRRCQYKCLLPVAQESLAQMIGS